MENPYVINLNREQKRIARQILSDIPPITRQPHTDDDYLHLAAAASLFSGERIFGDMVKKITDVSSGISSGLVIHGFPIGQHAADGESPSMRAMETGKIANSQQKASELAQNPSLWAERGSQLYSVILGLIGRKPKENLSLVKPFDLGVSADDLGVSAETFTEMKLKHHYPEGKALKRDPGQNMHSHAMTAIFGINSGGLDMLGNDQVKTYIMKGSDELRDIIVRLGGRIESGKVHIDPIEIITNIEKLAPHIHLAAPLGRGDVGIIKEGELHFRASQVQNAGHFQRLAIATVFTEEQMPDFSTQKIEDYKATNNFRQSGMDLG